MKKIVLFAVFVLLLTGCGQTAHSDDAEVTIKRYNKITYKTAEAKLGDFYPVIEMEVKSETFKKIAYSLENEGMEVDRVYVKVGDIVSEGELLISCKSGDIEKEIESYETKIARNHLLYDHLVSLGSIEESKNNTVSAEQVKRAIEIDLTHVKELKAKLESYNIVAKSDGMVVDIANGLEESAVGKTQNIITVVYGDGYFYGYSRNDVKFDREQIYEGTYETSKYYLQYQSQSVAEDGRNRYVFKALLNESEFCVRGALTMSVEEPPLVNVLYVPEECIIKTKDAEKFVYLLDEQGYREAKEVTVTMILDGNAIIGSGLQNHDEVVINEKKSIQ